MNSRNFSKRVYWKNKEFRVPAPGIKTELYLWVIHEASRYCCACGPLLGKELKEGLFRVISGINTMYLSRRKPVLLPESQVTEQGRKPTVAIYGLTRHLTATQHKSLAWSDGWCQLNMIRSLLTESVIAHQRERERERTLWVLAVSWRMLRNPLWQRLSSA